MTLNASALRDLVVRDALRLGGPLILLRLRARGEPHAVEREELREARALHKDRVAPRRGRGVR